LNPGRSGGKPATNRLKYYFFIFIYLACEAIGTAATPGLLCQPRVMVKMIVEKQMECRLAGETEILGENLLQRHFCPVQMLETWPSTLQTSSGLLTYVNPLSQLQISSGQISLLSHRRLLGHEFEVKIWQLCDKI
jgi:hypothetical protein